MRKYHYSFYLFFLIVPVFFSCQSADVKDGDKNSIVDGDETIPRKYKTIYIHNFENSSFEGDLTGEVKDMLSQKMGLQKRFQIESDKTNADVWLYGKIEYYKLMPRDIDEFGKPARYNMTIVTTIWVRPNNKISDESILDKKVIRFDTFYAPYQPPYETEFTAKQRVISGLCDRIVNTVLIGWYSNLKSSEELGVDPKTQKNIFEPKKTETNP